MLDNLGFHMLENKFKQIYVDLEDEKWYIANETSDSNLKALKVEINTAVTTWYVKHWRKTTKVFIQVLDNTNSEIIPEKIIIEDINTIRIDFFEATAGTLHLVYEEGVFYDILPTPTPTITPSVTPTNTVTPTVTSTTTPTVTPTISG
jgi:hypothetical protein